MLQFRSYRAISLVLRRSTLSGLKMKPASSASARSLSALGVSLSMRLANWRKSRYKAEFQRRVRETFEWTGLRRDERSRRGRPVDGITRRRRQGKVSGFAQP